MGDDSIIVAVRVRPFNGREKEAKADLVVRMVESQTFIRDPDTNKEKPYTYDYSFWSHNKDDSHFVDNTDVYEKIGKKVLQCAWEGYNVSLFAYGQTGAGKSHSMVGYPGDTGIIPRACDEIFTRIKEQTTESRTFKVEASMLEIYNEQVKDLFNPSSFVPGGLKVREHPKTGVFVDGLVSLPVHSYVEIDDLLEKGSQARTVGATAMNATSSRAHTIFIIQFTSIEIEKTETKEEKREKSSKMSLIDLAGSERAGDTGATGDRLKEGCAINKSLSALGDVIGALVKKSQAKGKKKKEVFIPYRGSTLTWLMKDSLGGNSKTIMIAAISPASICYQESVSTLKYANRAKQIKNKAVVNEDKNVKMIRELKKEVAELKKALAAATGGGDLSALLKSAGGGDDNDGSDPDSEKAKREMEELKAKLAESQSIIQNLSKTDQEKEDEKTTVGAAQKAALDAAGAGVHYDQMIEQSEPFICNMHPDPMMDSRIIFIIKPGENVIGRRTKDNKPSIPLGGVGIGPRHVVVQREGRKCLLIPQPNSGKTFLNGVDLAKETEVKNQDRIIIGSHTYRFVDPVHRKEMDPEELKQMEEEFDYHYAQQEFADKQGMSQVVNQTKDDDFERKMKEMQDKFERERQAQAEALAKEKEEMDRKRREMEENFTKLKSEASQSSNVELVEKQLEQRRRAAELKFQQQQQELAEKRKKLEEEMKRQEELAQKLQLKKKKEEEQRKLLEQNLLQLIPMVREANSMSVELIKNVRFSTKLIAYLKDDGTGKQETRTDLGIYVQDMKTGKAVMWNYDKFQSRYYLMQEQFQNFLYSQEHETEFVVDKDKDPFYDPENDEPALIGISMIYLKALSHKIDMKILTPIINSKGEKQGDLDCGVVPCTADGKEVTTDFVPDPYTLEGQEMYFKVRIDAARGLPIDQCKDSFVRFRISFLEEKLLKTKVDERKSTFPKFEYEKIYHVPKITKEFIDYLRNSAVKFEIFAKENTELSEVRRPGTSSRPNTAQMMDMQEKEQYMRQMQELSSNSDRTEQRRQFQRQDSMNVAAQMMMKNRLGNDDPVARKRTIVRIDDNGHIILQSPPPSGGSEACSVM